MARSLFSALRGTDWKDQQTRKRSIWKRPLPAAACCAQNRKTNVKQRVFVLYLVYPGRNAVWNVVVVVVVVRPAPHENSFSVDVVSDWRRHWKIIIKRDVIGTRRANFTGRRPQKCFLFPTIRQRPLLGILFRLFLFFLYFSAHIIIDERIRARSSSSFRSPANVNRPCSRVAHASRTV